MKLTQMNSISPSIPVQTEAVFPEEDAKISSDPGIYAACLSGADHSRHLV